jgi:glycosyltransferase involved in cell wall biosynthesis
MNTLESLLTKISSQAGGSYFVRSESEGRKSPLSEVLKKIENSRAQAVVLSPQVTLSEYKFLRENLLRPFILQIGAGEMSFEADYYELLVTPADRGTLLEKLKDQKLKDRAYVVLKDFHLPAFLDVQESLRETPFYFEFSTYGRSEGSLSSSQVYSFIRNLAKMKVKALTPPGRPVWDDSVPGLVELEPLAPVSYQLGASIDCDFSIIIPTYNSKFFLLNVLRHLCRQDYPQDKYEIIVVDDGSTDDSMSYIEGHFRRHLELKNLKYIYLPRPPSVEGEFFRAGICRNLGVSHSTGKNITFLDSDILVPRNFLSDLAAHLEKWDVIQNVRYHVKPKFSTEFLHLEEVDFRKQTYIEEESYWRPFFECQSWQALNVFWKFTCTYCLTLKKEDFLSVGRFRRNFVSYGFEDTDLGFRLFKAGRKFHLSRNLTLHLTGEKSKAEHETSRLRRQFLLSKTAKKFFLNNLDPVIYEHLRFYMGGEYPYLAVISRAAISFSRRLRRMSSHFLIKLKKQNLIPLKTEVLEKR